MNHYEQKQEARRQRLEARAARLKAQGNARYDQAHRMAEAIPFGQPILVGHHSEKRDRAYRGKIENGFRKGFELMNEAKEVAARAAAVGSGGISSDDPDAVVKLKEQLAEVQAKQDRMKAVNKAHAAFLKKGEAALEGLALSEGDKKVIREYVPPYSWEKHPFAPYQISNNGANIRRIEARIEQLGKAAEREHQEILHNSGVRLVQNVEANRIQLFFPGKPEAKVREELKSRGFRWSPMEGVWQRHLNNSGVWAGKQILEWLNNQEVKA